MNHAAMNKSSVLGSGVPCPCGFVARVNVSCVDDIQEEYAGLVLPAEFVCVHLYYIAGFEVCTVYPSRANAICYFSGLMLTVAKACTVFT